MRLKSSYDPFSVEYESGVGPMLILASLLGLAGIFIASIPFFSQAENIREAGLISCMIGAGFVLMAIAVAFLRKGLKIDTSSGEMTKWFGFSGFIFHKSLDHLKNYSYVKISRKEHRRKNGVYYSFPISIAPEKGRGLALEDFNDPLHSRLFAENSALLLKMPLLDASEQVHTIRPPDELNMSLRKQAEKHCNAPKIEELGDAPAAISGFASIANRHLEIKMPENFRAKFKSICLVAALALGFTMSGTMIFVMANVRFGGRFGSKELKWIYSALYAILAGPLDKSG